MNTDYRIKVGIFEHPKMKKLNMRLGKEAGFSLLQLLRHVAVNHPSGHLDGMDHEDILIAADWTGHGDFIQALIDVRWLDRLDDGTLQVHDWVDHNPWAAGAPRRIQRAQKAAAARWGCSTDASSNAISMISDATSNESDATRYAPTPSPNPIPIPKNKTTTKPPSAPPEPSIVSAVGLVGVLLELGVSEAKAKHLAAKYPSELITTQIDRLPGRNARNAAAVLVKSIEGNWAEPEVDPPPLEPRWATKSPPPPSFILPGSDQP